jgi:hypothetical protein
MVHYCCEAGTTKQPPKFLESLPMFGDEFWAQPLRTTVTLFSLLRGNQRKLRGKNPNKVQVNSLLDARKKSRLA